MMRNTLRVQPAQARQRWGLLLLLLLTFARLVMWLDAKDLWLDEGFSLQRAELDWPTVVRGTLHIVDGVESIETIDQHPFGFFVLLGLMLRAAGTSEFALRFPSVMVATLIVPAAWILARRLVRNGALPAGAPGWAALLTAINPFYLWYGQEVRMYALVALMALLSTYMVLCWSQGGQGRRGYVLGYLLTVSLLVTAHYYSIFILPVHAAIVYVRLVAANRRLALWAAVTVLGLGVLGAFPAALQIINQPGAGTNFVSVSLRILAPDLVNAFTLGLSVDLAQVWPIDVLSALVVMLGGGWGLVRQRGVRTGWLLPAYLVVPVLLLAGINLLRPAYMNARHMSLVSGAYLLLLSGGLAWLWSWRKQRWLGLAVTSLLLGGMLYSTANYYVAPAYQKGDLHSMGEHLREQMLPGDLLLIEPPLWHRLYRYYLPLAEIETWERAGFAVAWRAWPPVKGSPRGVEEVMEEYAGRYRRIWLARSEPDSEPAAWLLQNRFRAQEWGYPSPISLLKLELFLSEPPVSGASQPIEVRHPVNAVFNNQVRLVGYDLGQGFGPGYAVPVTLYWQALSPVRRPYKYILRWELPGSDPDGQGQILAITEHEPYDGMLSTTLWAPAEMVREYTALLSPVMPALPGARLTLQMYDAETLEKLPVIGGAGIEADGLTVILPAAP